MISEPAWTSSLNYGEKDGVFTCAYCGNGLFDSTSKYDSGSGWPSFWRSKEEAAIDYKMEFDGRLECRCGKCKSHLGKNSRHLLDLNQSFIVFQIQSFSCTSRLL
jgi:peptide-methionine (R)-S-oxide reductase